MSDNVTPAQLREDARRMRDGGATADALGLIGQGERVCLWVKSIEDDGSWGWDADCGGFRVRATHPRYCEHCGGRVVLGDEEGGDAR